MIHGMQLFVYDEPNPFLNKNDKWPPKFFSNTEGNVLLQKNVGVLLDSFMIYNFPLPKKQAALRLFGAKSTLSFHVGSSSDTMHWIARRSHSQLSENVSAFHAEILRC